MKSALPALKSAVMLDERPGTEIAQRLAQPFNKLLPPSATEAKKLQKQLMHAGYRSAESPIIFARFMSRAWPVFRCWLRAYVL